MPPARAGRILLPGWFILLLAPLFFASLARPFAWWDDLTGPATCMAGPEVSLAGMPGVFWRNLFSPQYLLRPTTCAGRARRTTAAASPRLNFPRPDEDFVFFFAPLGGGAELVISDLVVEEDTPALRLRTPARRYGAFAR